MALSQEEKLNKMLGTFGDLARSKLKSALASGGIPDEWLQDDESHLLQKAVLDSLCRDRPYRPASSTLTDEFDNLHLFI